MSVVQKDLGDTAKMIRAAMADDPRLDLRDECQALFIEDGLEGQNGVLRQSAQIHIGESRARRAVVRPRQVQKPLHQ